MPHTTAGRNLSDAASRARRALYACNLLTIRRRGADDMREIAVDRNLDWPHLYSWRDADSLQEIATNCEACIYLYSYTMHVHVFPMYCKG